MRIICDYEYLKDEIINYMAIKKNMTDLIDFQKRELNNQEVNWNDKEGLNFTSKASVMIRAISMDRDGIDEAICDLKMKSMRIQEIDNRYSKKIENLI